MKRDLENLIHVVGNNVILQSPFTDFNNNTILNGKQILKFRKHFLYEKSQIIRTNTSALGKIKVLQIVEDPNDTSYSIVIYKDSNDRVCFMIIKTELENTIEPFLNQAEHYPGHRIKTFAILNKLLFFGVINPKHIVEDIEVGIGYSSSLKCKFNYLFSNKLKKIIAGNSGSMLRQLISNIGFAKFNFSEIQSKYERSSEINNPVYIRVTKNNMIYNYPLKSSGHDKYDKTHYLWSTRRHNLSKTTQFFVRKSITGQQVVVVTNKISRLIFFKEWIAYFASKFIPNKKYNVYFEKFSKGASESAFEVFKYAISKNNENARYLLSSENEDYIDIKNTYGSKIVKHNSFKGFFVLFNADKLISSELPTHSLRTLYDNSKFLKKVILTNRKKIFLQHGVSLATNMFERGSYNKKVPIAPDYIVTNSKLETSFFLKYSDYKKGELIETGTPNLDIFARNKQEQKDITFMLTWRPWDIVGEVKNNSYLSRYIEFLELIHTDPYFTDKNVNVMLHPKAHDILTNQFPELYERYEGYFSKNKIKDILLRTKVLITDYSSISFYAFTGGSNVIFFWGDKEFAEQMYGAPNILQKNNAFGDIVYTLDYDLKELITKKYEEAQSDVHRRNFGSLVEHANGDNIKNIYNFICDMDI